MGQAKKSRKSKPPGRAEDDIIAFYQGIKSDVSLLLSHGHAHARQYPLWLVWSEVRIVRKRMQELIRLDAVVMREVIISVIAGGTGLRDLLRKLGDGE